MRHPYRALASVVVIAALIGSARGSAVSAQVSAKAYALPAAAADVTSVVGNMPNFMVTMDEGGAIPEIMQKIGGLDYASVR